MKRQREETAIVDVDGQPFPSIKRDPPFSVLGALKSEILSSLDGLVIPPLIEIINSFVFQRLIEQSLVNPFTDIGESAIGMLVMPMI